MEEKNLNERSSLILSDEENEEYKQQKKSNRAINWNTIIIVSAQTVALVASLLVNISLNNSNRKYRDAEQEMREMELQVRRVEATNSLLSELFGDVPERAFLSEKLASIILDSTTCAAVRDVVTTYFRNSFNAHIESGNIGQADIILAAGSAMRTEVGMELNENVAGTTYHVVVFSEQDKNDAIRKATAYTKFGYPCEVHYTPSGLYAVSLGRHSYDEAKRIRQEVIDIHGIHNSAWISTGEKWIHKVFPTDPIAGQNS